jgi:hypothetical protein
VQRVGGESSECFAKVLQSSQKVVGVSGKFRTFPKKSWVFAENPSLAAKSSTLQGNNGTRSGQGFTPPEIAEASGNGSRFVVCLVPDDSVMGRD